MRMGFRVGSEMCMTEELITFEDDVWYAQATSALDSVSERLVQDALERLMKVCLDGVTHVFEQWRGITFFLVCLCRGGRPW